MTSNIFRGLGKRLPTGMWNAAKLGLSNARIFLRHRKGLLAARKFRDESGLKLQLGCGSQIKDGWINIDIVPNADLTLDLREPLPLSDESCSII